MAFEHRSHLVHPMHTVLGDVIRDVGFLLPTEEVHVPDATFIPLVTIQPTRFGHVTDHRLVVQCVIESLDLHEATNMIKILSSALSA